MQIEGKHASRQAEVIGTLIRALTIAVADRSISDRQRDAIVGELDRAVVSLSGKTFQTMTDGDAVEALENLVLELRIKGASTSEPALFRNSL